MTIPLTAVPALAEGAARITSEVLRLLAEPSSFEAEPPVPSLEELCNELGEALNDALPALQALTEDIPQAEEDDLDELFDELEDIALDLAELRLLAWQLPLGKEQEGTRLLVIRLAELPLFALLAFLEGVKRLALAPWSEEEDREAPEFVIDEESIALALQALRNTPAGATMPNMPSLQMESAR